MAGRESRRRRKGTIKQGRTGDGRGDAHCPPHPGFVCGAMEEGAEGAAAPRVPFAPSPSRRVLPFLGLGATKEGGAEGGGASGKIREGPAAVPASMTTTTSTSIPRASDLETLLRARKLTLILDLDHTLLNSTAFDDLSPLEQGKGLTRRTNSDPAAGLFRLGLARFGMLTKLRPFAREFLEQASAMFEMSVYTLGDRGYARAAVKLLDPDGAYFGGRVVSSDDSNLMVTHVIARDPGTVKARWASQNGKFLVNPKWIFAASFRWCRPCEREFPVTRGI